MDTSYEQFKDISSSQLSFSEKKKIWLKISDMSEKDFDAMMLAQKARQNRVPKVGAFAPEFKLERLDRAKKRTGEFVKLSNLRGRPVALAFGSYTWPPFRIQSVRLNEIYQAHKNWIEFYLIYVQEAHPSDGWQTPQNLYEEVIYDAPTNDDERAQVGNACQIALDLQIPVLIDGIDNEVEQKYVAAPIRLFVINKDGIITYAGEQGPQLFDPNGWEDAIKVQTTTVTP